MKRYEGYDQIEAYTGDYEVLKPGGYICKIVGVQVEEREYGHLMRIAYDIAEGEHKDYYKRRFEAKKLTNADAKWPGIYYQTIKRDDLKYFKGFMTAIEKSNQGFKWDWDEKKLLGKMFGGVFGEEEFEKQDGSIGTLVKCRFVKSVDSIREGKFKVPEKKTLSTSTGTNSNDSYGFYPLDEDTELPF